ncbi:DUF3617 domain-containing protein [Polymorphobacter multimanifer]|uniref:DUF3617 family protein n=1 Tax=Polymorphobacter multimanifer TaxID=1070431 RepID=A0A841LHP6_9SPHN|nr:DUF3617 domain-containing protein [Polymorphobacter multimanifer]MBB6228722.1 hypothetical protein [Polymorphobacter multimanifer]
MRTLPLSAVLLGAAALAAPALAAPVVTPGEWTSTMTMDSMTMPGLPPGALDAMKGKPITTSYCLTPEEAEADPKKILAADKSCKVDRFNMAGGKIDSAMTCQTPQGPATITMSGTYTADSYAMNSTMKAGPMTMASRVSARRLGPCK